MEQTSTQNYNCPPLKACSNIVIYGVSCEDAKLMLVQHSKYKVLVKFCLFVVKHHVKRRYGEVEVYLQELISVLHIKWTSPPGQF
jgi:hypothetical protein